MSSFLSRLWTEELRFAQVRDESTASADLMRERFVIASTRLDEEQRIDNVIPLVAA